MISPRYDYLSIATGYWDLPGSALLIDKLLWYKKIRLLIGREPLINRHQLEKPEPDFPDKDIFSDLESMSFKPEYKSTIEKIKSLIENWTLEVKVYTKNFLHAKCYIFGSYESDTAIWIIWSSNFTKAWLTWNSELNALEQESRIVQFQPKSEQQEVWHLYWFDSFWNDEGSKDWTGKFTAILEQSTHGDVFFTPYEMYIKVLYEMYNDELSSDVVVENDGKYTLMSYQVRNVHNLMKKLEKKKVAMLADSVWLGKTATAIEVIKQYKNPKDKSKWRRVEVIVPSSLEWQWKSEMAKFWLAEDSIEVTPFHNENRLNDRKKIDKYAPVNLFVIDESHNLRSMNSTRFEWVSKRIEQNPDSHVLLLTATPINNQIQDLSNQILLAAKWDPKIATVIYETANKKWIKIDTFDQALKDIQAGLKRWKNQDQDIMDNYDRLKRVTREVISKFLVRNTRQWVMKDPEFKRQFPNATAQTLWYSFNSDLTKQIINEASSLDNAHHLLWFDTEKFTDKERSKKTVHPLDEVQNIPLLQNRDIDEASPIFFVYQLILLLGFVPYRRKMYDEKFYNKTYQQIYELKLEAKEKEKITRQLSIYGILRVSYLKRLESSVDAIRKSIEKYQTILQELEKSIVNNNQIISFKKLDLAIEYLQWESMDDEVMNLIDPYDIPDWFKKEQILLDIKRDMGLIQVILKQLNLLIWDDSKIALLWKTIETIHNQKINNGKVLVFSFFSDTIDYLSRELPKYCNCLNDANSAFWSAKNKSEILQYANRFAPIAKDYDFKSGEPELQFLFATDVLSEGQNLQDCGIIINYDLHRNPVRMIQRNGRINRLGSQFDDVYIYNMFPEKQLDHYLGLIKRLEDKIDLITFCIGLDQPILSDTYEAVDFVDDIKKLYTQAGSDIILELEQKTDLLSTEDGFLQDLKDFHETADEDTKQKVYQQIPFGKWWFQPSNELPIKFKHRPPLLISSKVFTKQGKDIKDENIVIFAKTDLQGKIVERMESLIALQYLKAQINDQNPTLYNLQTINREYIAEHIKERILEKYEIEAQEWITKELKPTELKFIETLVQLWYSPNIYKIIKRWFTELSSVIREKQFKSLYIEAKKNPHNLQAVQELSEYAKESLDLQDKKLQQNDAQQNDDIILKPIVYHISIL